ncbi:MAG: 3-phosphoshikimate 1-carboxyvinyltransferase, partial [Acidobacteria bacterium]|nr:3-phosphoshikimate 1-carboxyvinyltransferase [Acidobacteriota bacterium]
MPHSIRGGFMLLRRATGPIRGRVTPPPSKSITHRALLAAALGHGTTVIENPLDAQDTRLTAAALSALGAPVSRAEGAWTVTGFRRGAGGLRPAADLDRAAGTGTVARADGGSDPVTLDLGNSGTSLRFLLPLAALLDRPVVLDGSARLRQRPLGAQAAALRALGAQVDELGEPGCPPVRVRGPIRSGRVTVDAGGSSQIVSGLLLAGAALRGGLMVTASALSSRPYVDLTLAVMNDFGLAVDVMARDTWSVAGGCHTENSPRRYRVEADASAAAFLLAAGVVSGGRVLVEGVGTASPQGDVAFLDLLARMGCEVTATPSTLAAAGPPTSGITADLNATPDLVPPLAAVALLAPGPSRLTGIGHLRVKESDRLAALAREFSRLGGHVTTRKDELLITPLPLSGAAVSAHGDHRIAMALAIAALRVPGTGPGDLEMSAVDLDDPACVGKSYPDFFR